MHPNEQNRDCHPQKKGQIILNKYMKHCHTWTSRYNTFLSFNFCKGLLYQKFCHC